MPFIRIKNCGLNSQAAVDASVQSGAEFLGFIVYPRSPRHVDPADAAHWTRGLPLSSRTVLVTVNPEDAWLEQTLLVFSPDLLQLHGDESPERVADIRKRFALPVIKALPVAAAEDITRAHDYETAADYLLFDTKASDGGVSGGTGRSFDWSLLTGKTFAVPHFVSGGLHSGNVAEALRISGAPMVDTSSGLESSAGVKDAEKIRLFNQTVHAL